jgi:hypothetical protein
MKIRPAITAARAQVLAFGYSAIATACVLGLIGESDESDLGRSALFILVAGVCAAVGVLYFRYWPPRRLRGSLDPVSSFVAIATLITAFGTTPLLIGFVTFFLGGGYLTFGVGMGVSSVLVIGPGRPTEAMVWRIAERMDPGVEPAQLWLDVLNPAV